MKLTYLFAVVLLAGCAFFAGRAVGQRGADRWWSEHQTLVMPATTATVNGTTVTCNADGPVVMRYGAR